MTTFVQLAEAGAYMGGDRRVHHIERSKWRHTFRLDRCVLLLDSHAAALPRLSVQPAENRSHSNVKTSGCAARDLSPEPEIKSLLDCHLNGVK